MLEHVEKIGIAPGIELVRALQLDAALLEKIGQDAVGDGGAHLRLDVVTDDRNVFVRKALAPRRIAGDKDRNVVDKSNPGLQRAIGIKPGSFF